MKYIILIEWLRQNYTIYVKVNMQHLYLNQYPYPAFAFYAEKVIFYALNWQKFTPNLLFPSYKKTIRS